jgi:hypothetical protein
MGSITSLRTHIPRRQQKSVHTFYLPEHEDDIEEREKHHRAAIFKVFGEANCRHSAVTSDLLRMRPEEQRLKAGQVALEGFVESKATEP